MDDLISRKKLLKDLAGMLDVCTGAGDPFLAAMIRKAMECVERQQPVSCGEKGCGKYAQYTCKHCVCAAGD